MSAGAPSSSNFLQWGQDSDPISTSFTLALGLPIMNPAAVALTTFVQFPPAGGVASVIFTVSGVSALPLPLSAAFLLQPAAASTAAAQRRNFPALMRPPCQGPPSAAPT